LPRPRPSTAPATSSSASATCAGTGTSGTNARSGQFRQSAPICRHGIVMPSPLSAHPWCAVNLCWIGHCDHKPDPRPENRYSGPGYLSYKRRLPRLLFI
jgi:hypothetical protein